MNISQRLRTCAKHTALDAVIELLNEAADEIDRLSGGQQADAKTDEPVAWVVMNGLSKYQVCGAKAPADALCSEMQKRHDLSGSLAAFHVQPLYTHPAPGVPDDVVRDAERYRWLAAYCRSTPEHWGGRWSIVIEGPAPKTQDSEDDFDAAIDAAMAASPAQKGEA